MQTSQTLQAIMGWPVATVEQARTILLAAMLRGDDASARAAMRFIRERQGS